MTPDPVVLENTQDWKEALAHPNPDPDTLPAVLPPELVEQEQTATHLLRASIRLDDDIAKLKAAMDADIEAWGHALAKLQAKREAWRAIVKDWMLRNNVTQLKCPWFTASITKPRTKKVIPDEEAFILQCKAVGYTKAIKVIEKLIKAEADIIADTMPEKFKGLFVEETSDPGLSIRKAKE